METERIGGCRPIVATLAVVARAEKILLVKRANPPDVGLWGFPGGKIEAGETIFEAARRELLEETGVVAHPERSLSALDAFDYDEQGRLRYHFVLIPVVCVWEHGVAVARDDALEAAWFDQTALSCGAIRLSLGVAEVARSAISSGVVVS